MKVVFLKRYFARDIVTLNLKIFLKEDNNSVGLEKGWNIESVTQLTQNVNFNLRGEEYSSQIDYFFECIKTKSLHNKSSFESASQTDEVVNLLLKDK